MRSLSRAAIALILTVCAGVRIAAGQPAGARVPLPTGIEMRYVERGAADGEVVVFLHGYTDSSRSFLPTIGALEGPACATTSTAQESPIDLDEARRAFAAAKSASDRDAGRLWGVELYGPAFLVDPGSRFAVADRADPEGALEEREGVWVGTLPEEINPANTAIDWSGLRWTMVLWPTPSLSHARDRLLLHEMFHRVQDAIGLAATNPANAHLDSKDGRIWMRLEMRALAEALMVQGDGRAAAIADALGFRAKRRGLFPQAAADEDALERNEGMAEYTGLVLGGLPVDVLADRAAVGLEQREGSESLSRSFAYATGPAYGVLLDASGEPWRDTMVEGGSLWELLEDAYGVGPVAAAEPRVGSYNGERVIAIETAREEERLVREAELRGRFVEGPVVRMAPGGFPVLVRSQSSGRPGRRWNGL